jgi:phosphohistidine phosphatase
VPFPTVALVSPSARTAATAELVLADLTTPPEVRPEKVLYNADADEVLDELRRLEDDVRSAMVVGHNPTAHELSQALIAPTDKKGLSVAARRGFPTCALGIYRFPIEHWREVALHEAKLVALLVPPFGD